MGHNRRYDYKRAEAGGVFTPTALGIELFGWANAKPTVDCFTFFDKDTSFEFDKTIKKPAGCYEVLEKKNSHTTHKSPHKALQENSQ